MKHVPHQHVSLHKRAIVLATLILMAVTATAQAGHVCKSLLTSNTVRLVKDSETPANPACAVCANAQSAVSGERYVGVPVDGVSMQASALPSPQPLSLLGFFELHVRPPPQG